jgi:general secretion pathway protein D
VSPRSSKSIILVGLLACTLGVGCAARRDYREARVAARHGDWDLAVARLMRAVERDPNNIRYRMELEDARTRASRAHAEKAHKRLAEDDLNGAIEEMDIASKLEPSNAKLAGELEALQSRKAKREAEQQKQSDFDAALERARAATYPVPVLSPRSRSAFDLKFQDTAMEKVFDSLGRIAGVNIIFDPDVRGKEKAISVDLKGVTFEEALDQLTLTNKLFYKVLDGNTLLLAADTPQKRKAYEEMVLRTFYLQNVDKPEEVVSVVTKMLSGSRTLKAQVLAAKDRPIITMLGTPDQVALADRIIKALDKPRGEVLVEVRILEVSRNRLKNYGIALSNDSASVLFSPTGADQEITKDTNGNQSTNLRANLVSSLNLSDFVVSIPASIFSRFLQTDSTVRLLASPRLRAGEGKKTTLKIGTKVPIPQTSFTAYGGGTGTGGTASPYTPYTSFNYQDVGVELEFTPKVNPNGDILLDEFRATFSLLGEDRSVGGDLKIPVILSREIGGTLRLRDGETSLIGGLIQGREAESMSGILGLQSIPLVNKILGSQNRGKDESEILISLTPHLVRGPTVMAEDLEALPVGTQEHPRVPGARPALFGEEPAEEATSSEKGAAPAEPGGAPQPEVSAPSSATAPAPSALPAPPTGPPVSGPPTSEEGAALSPTGEPPGTAGPRQGQELSAQLSPVRVSLAPGSTARISLIARGLREATAVEAVLVQDSDVVEVGSMVPGALLTLGGAPAQLSSQRQGNRITVNVALTAPGPGVTGSGAIVVLTLTGKAAGQTNLRLESLVVTAAGGAQTRAEPGGASATARITVTGAPSGPPS